MYQAFLQIALMMAAGALCIPVILFALARIGLFPPIVLRTRAGIWRIAPKSAMAVHTGSNTAVGSFSNYRSSFATGAAILVVLPAASPSADRRALAYISQNTGTLASHVFLN